MTEAVAYVSTVTAEEAAMLLAEGDATEGTEGEGTEGGETAAAGSLENPVKILPGNLHMGIYSAGSGSIVVNHLTSSFRKRSTPVSRASRPTTVPAMPVAKSALQA